MKLAQYSGLLPSCYPDQPYYKLITINLFVCSLLLIGPQAAFYLSHLDNLYESTESFSMFFACVVSLVQVMFFVIRNREFKDLYNALVKLESNANVHTTKADEQLNLFSKWFLIGDCLSLFVFIVTPMVEKINEYVITGKIFKSKWRVPMKVS